LISVATLFLRRRFSAATQPGVKFNQLRRATQLSKTRISKNDSGPYPCRLHSEPGRLIAVATRAAFIDCHAAIAGFCESTQARSETSPSQETAHVKLSGNYACAKLHGKFSSFGALSTRQEGCPQRWLRRPCRPANRA
jgi:hypothetical protein